MKDASRELVEQATRGDREARDALMATHLPGLRAFIHLRLGRAVRARETSLDLLQSVCREALGHLQDFEYRGEGSFRHWLFRRAENKIRDRGRYWRREKRNPEREVRIAAQSEEDSSILAELKTLCTPSRHASGREELVRLEQAFARLPEDYRDVIVLARLVGLPHAELARQMNRTPLATRTLLSRALARLATLLEE